MINAIECSDALVERMTQAEAKGKNRNSIKRLLRQIRDWWNIIDTDLNYEEINNRIQEQRLKYEIYRRQF